jgi:drug/metabolite transporter (DMT)-like permease
MRPAEPAAATKARLVPALLVIYLVWGSTYLAIRYAIETLPGFTMASTRFILAGLALYLWGRARGGARPTWRQLATSAGIGTLLLLLGNGGVVWAEYRVSSGVTALLIASEPVWVALLTPLILRGSGRIGWRGVAGLALGLLGVAILVVDPKGLDPTSVDPLGAAVILLSSLGWALGSLWSVRAELPASRAVAIGTQMLCGGLVLAVAGALAGEWGAIDPASFSLRSLLALGYLILFGSILAFSAYSYLLRVAPPGLVATYAFVNPVVAVLLGWLLVDEPLGWRVAGAAVPILGALALIFGEHGRGGRAAAD